MADRDHKWTVQRPICMVIRSPGGHSLHSEKPRINFQRFTRNFARRFPTKATHCTFRDQKFHTTTEVEILYRTSDTQIAVLVGVVVATGKSINKCVIKKKSSYPEEMHVLTSAPPNAKPANMDAAARMTLSNSGVVLWLVDAAAAVDDDDEGGFDDTVVVDPTRSPEVLVRWRSDDRGGWVRSRSSSFPSSSGQQ